MNLEELKNMKMQASEHRHKLKFFEIRDRATFIAVAAFNCDCFQNWLTDWESRLLKRCGFGPTTMIYVVKLNDQKAQYDAYCWPGGSRTMNAAHVHIEENWEKLKSGDVIDVEFINGETKSPKTSELYTHP